MVIIKVLVALIAFSFIVWFHELFHFIAAKLLKVPVCDFSVGMGSSVVAYQNKRFYFLGKRNGEKINKDEMSYNLRILPIGGFVAFENVSDTKEFDVSKSEYYNNVHPFKRILISAAGPLGNFVLAFLMLFYFTAPVTEFFALPGEVHEVTEGGWAEKHSIMPGDVISTVNGLQMNNKAENIEKIEKSIKASEEICVTVVKSSGEISTICDKVTEGMTALGVSLKVSFVEAIVINFDRTISFIQMTVEALINLFAEFDVKSLSGPIGTLDAMQQSIAQMDQFILILILVNISLGVFNLLFPISAVDGGKIVIDFICLVLRKKYLRTTILDTISFVVIIGLFLFTGVLDIQRIAERLFG